MGRLFSPYTALIFPSYTFPLGSLQKRDEARIDEVRGERSGEVNVLLAERDREAEKNLRECVGDGMLEQLADRRGAQPEAAEAGVEVADGGEKVGLVIELRRLLGEHERVFESEAVGLADQLCKQFGEALCEGRFHAGACYRRLPS